MDFSTVQASLNDLPPTFKRTNTPFLQFVDSESAALSRMTIAADTMMSMVANISNAQYGWLDFWGLLFGIARNPNEPDAVYLARTLFTLQNGAGPPLAITEWIQVVWGVTAILAESFPALGYSLTFPPAVTLAQVQAIVQGLNRVRPAGVPFALFSASTGTYLDTVNFLDCPRITGAYVGGSGATRTFVTQSAATPNSAPSLPTLFMTDPTLNDFPAGVSNASPAAVLYAQIFLPGVPGLVIVPINGFSITLVAQNTALNPAGILATGTIIMPAIAADQAVYTVCSSQQVTAVTWNGNGATMVGAPAFLSPGTPVAFMYDTGTNAWYPI